MLPEALRMERLIMVRGVFERERFLTSSRVGLLSRLLALARYKEYDWNCSKGETPIPKQGQKRKVASCGRAGQPSKKANPSGRLGTVSRSGETATSAQTDPSRVDPAQRESGGRAADSPSPSELASAPSAPSAPSRTGTPPLEPTTAAPQPPETTATIPTPATSRTPPPLATTALPLRPATIEAPLPSASIVIPPPTSLVTTATRQPPPTATPLLHLSLAPLCLNHLHCA